MPNINGILNCDFGNTQQEYSMTGFQANSTSKADNSTQNLKSELSQSNLQEPANNSKQKKSFELNPPTETSPKEKTEDEIKNNLETIVHAIKTQDKDKLAESNPELLLLMLNVLKSNLNQDIEKLTQKLAAIDTSNENAINNIINLSSEIELKQELQKNLMELSGELTQTIGPSSTNPDPEIQALLNKALNMNQEARLEESNLIFTAQNEIQEQLVIDTNLNLQPTNPIIDSEEINKTMSLDFLKMMRELLKVKAENTNPSETIADGKSIDLLKMDSVNNIANEAQEWDFNENGSQEESSMEDSSPELISNMSSGNEELANNNAVLYSLNQVEIHNFENPAPIKLPITQVVPHIRAEIETLTKAEPAIKEIKLQITPDEFGKAELTITRNDKNEINIKITFADEGALTKAQDILKDSVLELREVLKQKNLDLSKFEVAESSSSKHLDHNNSKDSNEAKEEQKNKYAYSTPNWIKEAQALQFSQRLKELIG